jgi:toxin ParE1/3/4
MLSRRSLLVLPKAAEDIEDLLVYSERIWGSEHLQTYALDLQTALLRIQEHPEIGIERHDLDEDLRSLPIGKHMILYYVFPDTIEIARIMHQRMDVRRFADD